MFEKIIEFAMRKKWTAFCPGRNIWTSDEKMSPGKQDEKEAS